MEPLLAYIRRSLQPQYSPLEIKSLAPIICTDLLGISMMDVYTGKDTDLSTEKQQKLHNIIHRLLQHEPVQYICGTSFFCGFSFAVSPAVLIPRPETEELVNLIAAENRGAKRILDIGTGSGCIAISLNKMLPAAQVCAWDVSAEALEVAKNNNLRLGAHVVFSLCDVFSEAADDGQACIDIIASNPPYVTESDKATMQPEVLDYEPATALFVSDSDPLCFYRRIAHLSKKKLVSGGKLYFEINQLYGHATKILLEEMGYSQVCLKKDVYDNDRFVTAIWV
jgi:release factor glutamine methyltransferase